MRESQMENKMKVLFMAESVTMAHITRPLTLALELQEQGYEVIFATSQRPKVLEASLNKLQVIEINHALTSEQFNQALSAGKVPFTETVLRQYIQEDLRLLNKIQPDIVIGDMRVSLQISARIKNIRFLNLTNIVWSPNAKMPKIVPECPLTKVLGGTLGSQAAQPFVGMIMSQFLKPFNKLRAEYGLTPLASLEACYNDGDIVAYLDLPGLVKTETLPTHHLFLGPLLFSAPMAMPEWFSKLPKDKKKVFVSMGSSGNQACLKTIIKSFKNQDVTLIVAGAPASLVLPKQDNVVVASYLPAREVIRECDLVICNGGSPMVYLALAEGVCVLGIPSNMDQHLTMQAFANSSATRSLRSDSLSAKKILKLSHELLTNPECKQNAQQLSAKISAQNTTRNFSLLMQSLSSKSSASMLANSAFSAMKEFETEVATPVASTIH